YVAITSSSVELRILTLATGVSTSLGIAGYSPRWSPTGNEIAFVEAHSGALKLTSPTGTNVRALAPGRQYALGIDWSPDGRWLVARTWWTYH
ncbi:hypothetical protein L6C46_14305, partial [Staphylococcus aureus]|uniref:TolB family protein n=1 Tax=Staphylococcus aureus TaxID=1280 RepID=UPI003D65C67B|nr:hypothetical protein [Staphylococcus aureus]